MEREREKTGVFMPSGLESADMWATLFVRLGGGGGIGLDRRSICIVRWVLILIEN